MNLQYVVAIVVTAPGHRDAPLADTCLLTTPAMQSINARIDQLANARIAAATKPPVTTPLDTLATGAHIKPRSPQGQSSGDDGDPRWHVTEVKVGVHQCR